MRMRFSSKKCRQSRPSGDDPHAAPSTAIPAGQNKLITLPHGEEAGEKIDKGWPCGYSPSINTWEFTLLR